VAAVVRPLTPSSARKIAPAPRNPTPVTTWAAIRVGSVTWPGKMNTPTAVKTQAPTDTMASVLTPAAWPRYSRSIPIVAPSRSATKIRKTMSSWVSRLTAASLRPG